MSQETLISQTSLSGSPRPATSWFPARPPSGYVALPYEDSEDDSDVPVELWALKPASDIEARPIPSSEYHHGVDPSPQDGPSSPRTRMLGVLRMFIILLTSGLPSTLFFSAFSWIIGGIVLGSIFKVAPYDTMDTGATFKASMAGAPVIALVVGFLGFLYFVLRRLPSLPRRTVGRDRQSSTVRAYDPAMDALAVSSICAPASVLAMPLGLVMMPRLATETFGVWQALGVSATGLGVLVGGLLLRFLPELLWCDTVDL
ncbi:hypothetical protein LXA43DRAFT_1033711 [Ganoderma leucocontextum]|nr:hypothetical protein LXA43DRAFT_1033711 [Ganoderma leucocontextum]